MIPHHQGCDRIATRVEDWTERRARDHIALCVPAPTVEAVMAKDLAYASVMDPDLPGQALTPARAIAELQRIRRVELYGLSACFRG